MRMQGISTTTTLVPAVDDDLGFSERRPKSRIRRAVPLIAVALIGVLATGVAGEVAVKAPAVYWTQVQVIFLTPRSAVNPNGYQSGSQSVISTAGIVAIRVGSSSGSPSVVSDSVTLIGQGVRHGYGVRLPNEGGQWAYNFTQPQLDVQAVGSSPAEVTTTLNQTLKRINDEVTSIQADQHVATVNLITTKLSPPVPPMYEQHGSRTRAAAATLLLGIGLTAAAINGIVHRRRRLVQRRTPRVS
ncbi:MAG: hypothetical protein JWM76_4874 [Pseudonocardiales bacterium]|nr:hypothetical protein [Pseudonocardiales bacterium]